MPLYRSVSFVAFITLGLLQACATSASSTDSPNAPEQNSGGPGVMSCMSQALTVTKVNQGESLVDIAQGSSGVWWLLKGNAGSLAVQQPGGARKELQPTGATGAAISPRSDGKVCVLWGTGKRDANPKISYACAPNFEVEDTGVALAMSESYLLGFRDSPSGAAAVFAETNALDGVLRDESGKWSNANLMESSISFGGGPRALAGAEQGSPYCFIVRGAAVFQSFGLSGSANKIGQISIGSKTTFYTDVGCAVANGSTPGTLGLLAVGGGKAKFKMALSGATERDLDTADINAWTFAANGDKFHMFYAKDGNVFRAQVAAREASTAPVASTPVTLPNGAKATGNLAVAFDAQGTEHLAIQSMDSVLYARNCASPQ